MKNQNGYTKGPWKVAVTSDGFISVGGEAMHEMSGFIPTTFKNTVADVWGEEDARLIAAAPELLEVLHAFPMLMVPATTAWGKQVQDWQDTALAAISKAEGK